jgi:hypothetical protein
MSRYFRRGPPGPDARDLKDRWDFKYVQGTEEKVGPEDVLAALVDFYRFQWTLYRTSLNLLRSAGPPLAELAEEIVQQEPDRYRGWDKGRFGEEIQVELSNEIQKLLVQWDEINTTAQWSLSKLWVLGDPRWQILVPDSSIKDEVSLVWLKWFVRERICPLAPTDKSASLSARGSICGLEPKITEKGKRESQSTATEIKYEFIHWTP